MAEAEQNVRELLIGKADYLKRAQGGFSVVRFTGIEED